MLSDSLRLVWLVAATPSRVSLPLVRLCWRSARDCFRKEGQFREADQFSSLRTLVVKISRSILLSIRPWISSLTFSPTAPDCFRASLSSEARKFRHFTWSFVTLGNVDPVGNVDDVDDVGCVGNVDSVSMDSAADNIDS